jgi:hypothetical protein
MTPFVVVGGGEVPVALDPSEDYRLPTVGRILNRLIEHPFALSTVTVLRVFPNRTINVRTQH